jgi:hypothetical protein
LDLSSKESKWRLIKVRDRDDLPIPWDFNITFLNHMLTYLGLNILGCYNKLITDYTIDGYTQSIGMGPCIVPFTVEEENDKYQDTLDGKSHFHGCEIHLGL